MISEGYFQEPKDSIILPLIIHNRKSGDPEGKYPPIRLLYIEDDLEDRVALERKIRKDELNIDVNITSDIANAKRALETSDFDIVIADFNLPDGTISSLTGEFQKRKIPFVIATGAEDRETAIHLMKAGAADYLIKDFHREYLHRLPYVLNHVIYMDRLQKKAESNAATFRALFYESADPFLILEEGIIRDVNNAFITLIHGNEKSSFIGKPFSQYLISDIRGEHPVIKTMRDLMDHIHASGSIRVESILVRENGSSFFAEIVGTRICRDERELIHIAVRDITERVKAQEIVQHTVAELKEKNNELDRLSAELLTFNRTLEKQVEERTYEVSNLIEKRNELITRIGHDLKTPLTPIMGLLPVLADQITEPDLMEIISRNDSNAKNLYQVITKVFDLARLHSPGKGKNLTWIRLEPYIVMAISQNHEIQKKKKLAVHLHNTKDISLLLDPDHLELILENLIHNAMKFSEESGSIEISCIIGSDNLCIVMDDEGAGISSTDLPHIFEEFYCADSSRHDRMSHGLGLPTVRRVISLYGGTITAENRENNSGARFIISFQNHVFRREWDNLNNTMQLRILMKGQQNQSQTDGAPNA